MATSCDDTGIVELVIAEPDDDRTDPDGMGFALEVTRGDLPEGLAIPDEAVRATQGRLVFPWVDGATHDQEPVDFTLSVAPVDAGGNEGEAITVDVTHPGSGGGCASSGGRGGPIATLAMCAAAAMCAPRQRRCSESPSSASPRAAC